MISIAAGTVMRGDVVITGEVRLDGRFEGRLVCSRLEVGSDGYLNGTVATRELLVSGQIVGDVAARAVTLEDGAFIEGDVHYASIVLDAGATMTGNAVRAPANYVPPELSLLEDVVREAGTQLDRMEDAAREEMAKRAQAAYPEYQRARNALTALR